MSKSKFSFRSIGTKAAIAAALGISSLTIAAAGSSAAGNSFVDSFTHFFGFGSAAATSPAVDGDAPAASTTLVISQVYGGGGATSGTPTYTKDYIEIKNISGTTQSLNGLSLYYGSATGQFASSTSNAFALPDVTVAPGKYYLVELGPVGTTGGPLPVTADASSTTNLTTGCHFKR